jgi:two-component system response regulator HydG
MSDTDVAASGTDIVPARIVCLVEDDDAVRKALKRLLKTAGFEVIEFVEAKSFLDHLESNAVPVLVLDIWMNGMNGMQLLAQLCAKSPKTRVIFVTGNEDRAAETTVMQAGAFAFLIKPVEDTQFLNAVRSAFIASAAIE